MQPVTSADLRRALEEIGVAGGAIELHASLSAFGHVEGGADAVVDAALATCSTVLAPAFCFEPNWTPPADDRPRRNGADYSFYDDWEARVPRRPWVVEAAGIDASMGAVPRALLGRAGTVRSEHPWHSWLAWGQGAAELLRPHPWETTNLPLERLAARGGWVVLAGVELKSCTAVHTASELAGRRPFIRWMVDRDDVVRRIRVAGCSKGFNALWPHTEDLFHVARVGPGLVRAAPLAPLLERAAEVLREQPDLVTCSPDCIRCRDTALGGPDE